MIKKKITGCNKTEQELPEISDTYSIQSRKSLKLLRSCTKPNSAIEYPQWKWKTKPFPPHVKNLGPYLSVDFIPKRTDKKSYASVPLKAANSILQSFWSRIKNGVWGKWAFEYCRLQECLVTFLFEFFYNTLLGTSLSKISIKTLFLGYSPHNLRTK